MDSGPDWVARVIAGLALLVAVYREGSARVDARRKRKARSAAELRPALKTLRDALHAGAQNAADLNSLWSPRIDAALEQLEDLLPTLSDRKLKRLCEQVVAKSRAARSRSAPQRLDAYERMAARGVDQTAAREGHSACCQALERLALLERRSPV